MNRVLGRVRGLRPGPTLVGVGGLHGNEPAGVLAFERVLAGLEGRASRMAGEVVGLAGNLGALRRSRRFLDRDLNRAWTPDRVGALAAGATPPDPGTEDGEQAALLAALSDIAASARGPLTVLDLHTTSGPGGCFTTAADTLTDRDLALSIPVPLVLGLEELLDGTLTAHLGARGWCAVVFEAGQHDDPASVERAVAAVWIAVAALGILAETDLPELSSARKLLVAAGRGLPRVVEMRYRHGIEDEDRYRTNPGYLNFQRVERGETLGMDRNGEVRAPDRGRILMPLYQEQGNDGFFLVREIRPVWLHVSRALRRLRVARLAHWLPGVARDPDHGGVLTLERGASGRRTLRVLRLMGLGRAREDGDRWVVGRRPPPS